jgi:hypothetical protein
LETVYQGFLGVGMGFDEQAVGTLIFSSISGVPTFTEVGNPCLNLKVAEFIIGHT